MVTLEQTSDAGRRPVKAMSSRWIRNLLTTAIVLLGCAFAHVSPAEELQEFTEKRATPPLELKDMHGKLHSLADYSGQVVMVNFWAGWCHPCLQEIPQLIELAESLKDKPFTILAVNVAAEKKIAGYGFVKKMDEHMVILMDIDSKAFESWKGIGLPSTFVLDPAGVIRYEAYGPVNWNRADVVAAFTALMDGPSADDATAKE